MVSPILAVSSWLAGRLQQNPAPAASGVEKTKPKSLSEMRQTKAPVLSKEHFELGKESTRGYLFLAKYRDVLLRSDGVTRIIGLFSLTKNGLSALPVQKCTNTTAEALK
jgi:hypothetical protein